MKKNFLPYTLTAQEIADGKKLPLYKAKKNRKVLAKEILSHVDKFEMSGWFTSKEVCHLSDSLYGAPLIKYINNCGTSMCIAGWVYSLAPNKRELKKKVIINSFGVDTISYTSFRNLAVSLLCLENSNILFTDNDKALEMLKTWV